MKCLHCGQSAPSDAKFCPRGSAPRSAPSSSKSLELRAAMSLARLLAERGRRDDARGALAPVYGWFTEGLDSADLVAAKTLLADLG